jgi:hypothetical protein
VTIKAQISPKSKKFFSPHPPCESTSNFLHA